MCDVQEWGNVGIIKGEEGPDLSEAEANGAQGGGGVGQGV